MTFHPEGQYLEIHQTRDRTPGEFENLMGDALERAFATGIDDIDSVVQALVDYGVPAPDGQSWNADLLQAVLKRLSCN
jgi:phage tail tape-measure protein